jgi:hypothetical protein
MCAPYAFLALVSTVLSACSLVLDTSAQQCNRDDDCTNRGGVFAHATCANHVCVVRGPVDPDGSGPTVDGGSDGSEDLDAASDPVWGCLGHVVMGTPQAPTVKVALPFWDLIRMISITDVAVRTCAKLDVSCSRPVTPAVEAGADGVVRLDLPALFDGYGQVLSTHTGDAAVSRWVDSLVFFNPPLVRDTTYDRVPLFQPDDIKALAAVQGNVWDPQFGITFAGMLDCSGKPAAGVTWEPSRVDNSSKRFFYVNGLPDEAATATDSTGLGGLLNAPTGTITITATVQATGKRIGSATMLVRAGVASYTYLSPTP